MIINGKGLFSEHCTSCHGAEGPGDGPFAQKLNPKPFNLQGNATLHTDPELYTFIAKGIARTAMNSWDIFSTCEL
ncbi:MAG: c-type cytochrome [Dehalococcoidia bacterium]|nr:c-type cytochrome [Dehalococcoidia bacterium]